MEGILLLQDGRYFKGNSFGAEGERTGEVVFNTSMTGYQEILTDPSYKGQIMTMTYPLIGNYGVNEEDIESPAPCVEGFIVKECCRKYSSWRATTSLRDYLKKHNIIAIEGIDTRALTRHIRLAGAMKAIISTTDLNIESLAKKLKNAPGIVGRDLVSEVSCKKCYSHNENESQICKAKRDKQFKVVLMDFGVKKSIIKLLSERKCTIIVVPAWTKAEDILEINPHGIMLSNGPGDPAAVTYAIKEIKKLLGKKPIFGICLGHQLIGLALGGKTYKLKFGHRGANQPVKNLHNGRIEITSQNHGFAVDAETLKGVKITHINLNDNTLEGMEGIDIPFFSVQYHPEASPGPHDAQYLFDKFLKLMSQHQ